MNHFTPYSALFGGVLIGLAASLLLLAQGRISGISGILGSFLRRKDEHHVHLTFLLGLLAGGALLGFAHPSSFISDFDPPLFVAIPAGILVGFGTQLGSGCTSGHGICGVSRLSPRSLVATATFMLAGFVTVFVTRHVLGGLR